VSAAFNDGRNKSPEFFEAADDAEQQLSLT